MKNIFKIILVSGLFFVFTLPWPVQAQTDKINLYFFYGDGCPHCAKEEKFLNKLEAENDRIEIFRFEVWRDKKNAEKLRQIGKKLGVEITGVPVLVISDVAISGYYNDAVTGEKIRALINRYMNEECEDVAGPIVGEESLEGQCVHECENDDSECMHDCGCGADTVNSGNKTLSKINIPIIGEIDVKSFSLPLLTFIIAGVDGFNPCAMWVLLFLISLLLGVENRPRMWILGIAFIISSGAVYFLFLSAWLNIFLFLGFVFWVRVAIGLTALGSGIYHIKEYISNPDRTCKVTKNEKRKKIFGELKKIVTQQKLFIALIGIIILAVAVNLVELVCSAGLPAVYTQILSMAELPSWQYYGYLFFYIAVFMLDDMFVFFIAMTTLKMTASDSLFARYSGIVGGIIMLILGILLLFKPGWIMFG